MKSAGLLKTVISEFLLVPSAPAGRKSLDEGFSNYDPQRRVKVNHYGGKSRINASNDVGV